MADGFKLRGKLPPLHFAGSDVRSGLLVGNSRNWTRLSLCTEQIYNGLALLLVSLHPRFAVHRFAGPAIAVGSIVFSGSIMTLVLAQSDR